jgi:GNAT superfamily N-acetyltransferase
MDRNNTNFPTELTAFLKRAYVEHTELQREGTGGGEARRRVAAVLKYYQFLVHEYMGELMRGAAAPDRTQKARGLLVYHKMGLGKTFDALAVAITAIGALRQNPEAQGRELAPLRRTILIASKTLHGNFRKALERFLELSYPTDAEARARVSRRVTDAVTYVTMDAHNMADQVLAATRIMTIKKERKSKTQNTESLGALDGLLVIVDEAHNFFRAIINSPQPTTNARRLYSMIMSAESIGLMFLTGTPSSKHPFELVPCFNMLAGREILPSQYDLFMKYYVDSDGHRLKNRDRLANRLLGLVSYVGYDIPDEIGGTPAAPAVRLPPGVRLLGLGDLGPAERDAVEAAFRPVDDLDAADDHLFLFEERDGALLAHALVRPAGAPSSVTDAPPPAGARWLEEVYVPEPRRREGWGRRVVEAAAGTARLAALAKPGVVAFYAKLGFAPVRGANPPSGNNLRDSEKLQQNTPDGGWTTLLAPASDSGTLQQKTAVRVKTLDRLNAEQLRTFAAAYRPLSEVETTDGDHLVLVEGDAFLAYAVVRPEGSPSAVKPGLPPPPGTRWLEQVFVVFPEGKDGGLVVEAAAKISALATLVPDVPTGFAADRPGFYEKLSFHRKDADLGGWTLYVREGSQFSFPTRLPIRIERVEMADVQYRQYLMAREKEANEGGGGGGGGGPGGAPPPPPPLALPGSERGGGSTYNVQSRMFGNYAAPRKYMPTDNILDPNSITQVDPRDLPADAFTEETSPKMARIVANIAATPGPFLIYSQFVGIGGLAVMQRFLEGAGYVRYDPRGVAKKSADAAMAARVAAKKAQNAKNAARTERKASAREERKARKDEERAEKDEERAEKDEEPAEKELDKKDEERTKKGGGRARFPSGKTAVYPEGKRAAWAGYNAAEAARVAALEAAPRGELTFQKSYLTLSIADLRAGVDPYAGKLLPYRPRAEAPRLPWATNLHRGQRKLFLGELALFAETLEPDSEGVVVYAGAAPGNHMPYLASLYPRLTFHLYDPAPFSPAARAHPRLVTYSQFFTNETAEEWSAGGAQASQHGRPALFLCDIRLGGDTAHKFEEGISADMAAQAEWTRLMHPLRASMLKFRPPYLAGGTAKFQDKALPKTTQLQYLSGRLMWQCWPPVYSGELRLVVDTRPARLDDAMYPVAQYEAAAYTHNAITRPWARYSDREELVSLVPGYVGNWDARAEVEIWEQYSGRAAAGEVAARMNQLTKVIKQNIAVKGLPLLCGKPEGSGLIAAMNAFAASRPKEKKKKRRQARGGGLLTPAISARLKSVLDKYPSPGWVGAIAKVAESSIPFTGVAVSCAAVPRGVVGTPAIPPVTPLRWLGLACPMRETALAIVRFLVETLGPEEKATLVLTLAPREAARIPDYVAQLFPRLAVTAPLSPAAGDVVARLASAAGSAALVKATAVADFTCHASARWGCWSGVDPPAAVYYYTEFFPSADITGPGSPDRPGSPAVPAENVASIAVARAHIVCDRAWSRYHIPVSAKHGSQDLESVPGYDGCWDCTAEARTWMAYASQVHVPAGAGNAAPPTAAYYMNQLTEITGEPLVQPQSAHGRFVTGASAQAAANAAGVAKRGKASDAGRGIASVVKRGKAGGAEEEDKPYSYAVITGDVPVAERDAIREVWVSPENVHGDIIRGILTSKTGALGLDLKYGRQVHILEPYYDKSLEDQVIARFIRMNALDHLPFEDRTVQPFLYIAEANLEIRGSMPRVALEVPAVAAKELPLGTTVDAAFHHRALDSQKLNVDTRKFLEVISIERAVYGPCDDGRVCRQCQPSNMRLFHDSSSEDLLLPDPCTVMAEQKVAAERVELAGVTYRYVVSPGWGLGYKFYQKPVEVDGAYTEIDAASELYLELYQVVNPTLGV